MYRFPYLSPLFGLIVIAPAFDNGARGQGASGGPGLQRRDEEPRVWASGPAPNRRERVAVWLV